MSKNVGSLDKVVRVLLGIGILSLLFFVDGPSSYLGLIGIVPIGTALIGYCPGYSLFGFSTCPLSGKK